MMLPIYQVDAFSDRLFGGNPAAVVLLEKDLPREVLQSVAQENNLSETAFVYLHTSPWRIRWFTPLVEVDLCGHATLAAAHVLFVHRSARKNPLQFKSRSGCLQVERDGDWLVLDFPVDQLEPVEPTQALVTGLGATPEQLFRGRSDYLAVFPDEDVVRTLKPDMATLERVEARGIIATAPGNQVDFVSRFFAPRVGVPEDPVTGSAHTSLVPYWARRLGKPRLRARQLSQRGGDLLCWQEGDRVKIGGRAVTYLVGEIYLPAC
ncbi:MAG: PhzF family phenazine biosynthesis protein [Calditrichaeota bacterium]|nr:MAG: PhzF family phenazine biosynthesis protein [Calditrichota bacterium]